MVHWWEESAGVESCMRIIAMFGTIIGGIIALVGCGGWLFLQKADGITVMGVGVGLIGLCLGAKAAQSKFDNTAE